jgi:hypothetical protein
LTSMGAGSHCALATNDRIVSATERRHHVSVAKVGLRWKHAHPTRPSNGTLDRQLLEGDGARAPYRRRTSESQWSLATTRDRATTLVANRSIRFGLGGVRKATAVATTATEKSATRCNPLDRVAKLSP